MVSTLTPKTAVNGLGSAVLSMMSDSEKCCANILLFLGSDGTYVVVKLGWIYICIYFAELFLK